MAGLDAAAESEAPELLDHGDRLLGLALRAVDGGELGEEAGVGGGAFEGGGEECLGVGCLALSGEGVGEAGGGVGVVGSDGEEAAVGGLGLREGVGVLGEAGGEEDVGRSLGRELQGFEELVAGGVGVGVLVQDGEGAQGAGAKGRVGVGEVAGGLELAVGGVDAAVAGVDESEGELRLGEGWVGGDRSLVGGCGCCVVAGVLLREAEVVEDVGVLRLGGGEGLQGGDGGGVVAALEGGLGGADLGVDGLLRGGRIGLAGSGGKVLGCGSRRRAGARRR